MPPLPAHLGLQAKSDMRQAHATARADQSGHALACAMLLGQQAVEKHLKAIALMAAEIAGTQDIVALGGSLGHDVYGSIHALHSQSVEEMLALGAADEDANSRALAIRNTADFWKRHVEDRSMQELAWRRSISALPDGHGAARLDAARAKYTGKLGAIPGLADAGAPLLSGGGIQHASLREDMLYGRPPLSLQRDHMDGRWHVAFCGELERQFGSCHAALLRCTARDRDTRRRLAACLAAEFGLISIAMLGLCYMYTYPHALFGRYPERLADGVTTDIYESNVDAVLSFLFVDIPCQMIQIGKVGNRVLALRDACEDGELGDLSTS